MTRKTVISTIEKTCANKAEISIISSQSTESVYCEIKVGSAATKFRISDHQAGRNQRRIRTLVWGKSTTKEHVERFVKNIIRSLKGKSVCITMERLNAEKTGIQ